MMSWLLAAAVSAGRTALAATLNNALYTDVQISPTNAAAGISLDSDGTVDSYASAVYTNEYTWLTGGGVNSDYEARWTTTSGTLTSGTEATWESLSTDRLWYVSRTSDVPGDTTVIGTLEIRMAAAPNTVLATATITLTATVEP